MVEGRDRVTGGLWYGWVGCMGWGKRVGIGRVGVGLGYGWVGVRDGGGVCTGVFGKWVGLGYGRFGGEDRKWVNVTKDFSNVGMD